jgi:RNA 3'-terminal phosphate cyclase (ATP)
MIEIDGSAGEGGGQVLRSALTLSALTGQPVTLVRIRANREKSGLAPQHLAVVRAVAQVCGASVIGGSLRSEYLEFRPAHAPRPGDYTVDVAEAAGGGSAGAVTLILQALLLPLALAAGPSRVRLRGGTHVSWSPSWHYLAHVYLPMLARLGVRAEAQLEQIGFYPAGGGAAHCALEGGARLGPLTVRARGALRVVRGWAIAANLPAHIPQRMAARATNRLREAGIRAAITPQRERGPGPGAGLFLVAEYEAAVAGFAALGRLGKPSEQVAEEAALDLLAHQASGRPLDMHLADQLLLPAALAPGVSEFAVCRVTGHLLTNADISRRFLDVEIDISGEEGKAGEVRVRGAGA